MKFCMGLLIAILPLLSSASEICKSGKGFTTPHGRFITTSCTDNGVQTRKAVSLDGQKLIEDSFLYDEAGDTQMQRWIFSGANSTETACPKSLYLVDISFAPPKLFMFGVKGACTEFHWSSWGKVRSIIAVKNNVKFNYENDKLTPPTKDIKLISSIEPPHTGPDMDANKLQPFADELPLPK